MLNRFELSKNDARLFLSKYNNAPSNKMRDGKFYPDNLFISGHPIYFIGHIKDGIMHVLSVSTNDGNFYTYAYLGSFD